MLDSLLTQGYHLAMYFLATLSTALDWQPYVTERETGDNVFWLLGLMGGMALVAGLVDLFQYAKRNGFPIPLIIYCHLLPMVSFVYFAPQVQQWLTQPTEASEIALDVSRWPLYITLLPLPLVVLVRVFRSRK